MWQGADAFDGKDLTCLNRTTVLCGELALRARVEAEVLVGPVAVAQVREDRG